MEWEIKPFGKESSFSGNPFQEGDEVHCFLIRNKDGELARMDLHPDDFPALDTSLPVLGRWTRTFEAQPDSREAALSQQRTLEELFFSLFEVAEAVDGEETDTLKQIVALMLERKRILRRVPARSNASLTHYLHVKSKVEYAVSAQDISPAVVMRVQEQLKVLIQ